MTLPTGRMRTTIAGLLALTATIWTVPAAAQDTAPQDRTERIQHYAVVLRINPDSSLTVRETIRVYARGIRIQRGIFREIPTRYKAPGGREIDVGFSVLEVRRDGKEEPWHLRDRVNGKALYIGDADVFLKPNRSYTYTIVWRVRRALGYFEKHDELYWNAIGHGWRFRIDKAVVTIASPPGVKPRFTRAWTGNQGAQGENYTGTTDADGNPVLSTTRPLEPRQGMTVFARYAKGALPRPGQWTRLVWWVQDSPGAFAGAIGLLAAFGYFLFAWFRAGRDPEKGTIIPRYHPPKGFSPAACRHVMRMGFDNKSFAAAIVSMAVKGFLTIKDNREHDKEDGDGYILAKTGNGTDVLSGGEKAVAKKLFGNTRESLTVKKKFNSKVAAASRSLSAHLAKDYGAAFFARNTGWFVGGLAIVAVALLIVAIQVGGEIEGVMTGILALFVPLTIGMTSSAIGSFAMNNRSGGWLLLLSALAIGGISAAMMIFLAGKVSWLTVAIAIGLGLVPLAFYEALKVRTSDGRRVMDEIEGLRMYMTVAEEDRLKLLHPPDRTPEHFERLLPYALALNVENEWTEQFAHVLDGVKTGGTGYAPAWYVGQFTTGSLTPVVAGVTAGLSGAIAAASTAPGSSSGGGGGGFSGGGGGGGGGGGW